MIPASKIREKLCGYPESVLLNYEVFLKEGNPEYLHHFVINLIQFLQDAASNGVGAEVHDSTRLREDMGIDSITIAEVIFLLEEIFEIEINNQELMEISTLGELRQFVLSKLS